ncbi:MAG: protocatechuate 3,4-dioxygenase alpha subunit [Paracoccaceae bacterium]|jgi:protocatechuate 3,4-dioxygenase alpha subunit
MVQKLNALKESPSQTAGPYVHIGCTPNFVGNTGIYDEDLGIRMITGDAAGRRITIRGAVIDGGGAVLRDAMVEIWQADANGLFNSPEETRGAADLHFTGWGRSPGDFDTGDFTFKTIKPGAVALFDGRMQAPHITFWVVARGINIGLQTRMYFPEDGHAHATDPALSRIEHRDRVATLIGVATGPDDYRFDIRLQGTGETVFFDI